MVGLLAIVYLLPFSNLYLLNRDLVNRSHVNSIKIFIGKPEKKTRHFFQASSLIITNILFFAKVYIVVNRLNIF